MKRALLASPILLLCLTAGTCKTIEYRTVDTSCTSFRPITFNQLPPGQTDDPGNIADSDGTVDQIIAHDAKWDALCTDVNPVR